MNVLQKIDEEHLPNNFRNVIINRETRDHHVIIRSNLQNTNDINTWIKAFSYKTSTRWNFRKSMPESSAVKMVCMKTFYCHHTAYRKVPTDKQNRNKRGISKNTACEAQVKVKIKLTTRHTRFKDPYVKDGLPAIIIIIPVHNHSLENLTALKYLAPKDGVRDTFLQYFKMQMNVAQACRYHENELILDGNDENDMVLNNAVLNPTRRTVRHWFESWRNKSYGTKNTIDVEKILEDKISIYKKEGAIIQYQKEPFHLLVITPLMQRVHNLPCSKDQLFIESTSYCDKKNYFITFLLTATASGALPNAVLITKQQTTAAYTIGFKLLRESLASSFYNQNYANVVMTNNCSSEIIAVKKVWPESGNFFCIFHVLQYVIHWLKNKSHNIPKDKQQIFMCTFHSILCCQNDEDAENAFYAAIEISKEFPVWQNYLQDQWKNRKKWCLAYRVGFVNHRISNYGEISIRLFKENILNRIKAYNIIALLDFVSLTIDKFYSRKLCDCFNISKCKIHLYSEWVFRKSNYLKKEDIIMINDNTYTVPGEIGSDTYIIDVTTGWCNCIAGIKGTFCKHLCAVYQFFDLKRNNFPVVTVQDRRNMAYVAVGNHMLDDTYFSPLHSSEIEDNQSKLCVSVATNNNDLEEDLHHHSSPVAFEDIEFDIVECLLNEEHENLLTIEMDFDDKQSLLEDFKSEWDRVCSNLDPSYAALKKATERLKKLHSHDQLETALYTLANNVAP